MEFFLRAAAATLLLVVVIAFLIYLVMSDRQARRDLADYHRRIAEKARRDAYIPRHSCDGDTIALPVAALEAAVAGLTQRVEVAA